MSVDMASWSWKPGPQSLSPRQVLRRRCTCFRPLSHEARTVSTATSPSASLISTGEQRAHRAPHRRTCRAHCSHGLGLLGASPRLSKLGESESRSTSGWGRLGFQGRKKPGPSPGWSKGGRISPGVVLEPTAG